jgi:nicotinamide-nucleotide amidase
MNAEIITIGDEILIGQIVDTNSAFIGREFNKIGISIFQITSIQDEKAHILKALKEAEENVDIIIITGGLGPTKDDITKHTLCTYFDDKLVRNDEVLAHVEAIFSKYINSPISDINRQQALVPSKSQVLMNQFGTAPGMWIEKNGKVFVSLPGVPYEMKALITNAVIPALQKKFKFPFIMHKTLLTYGLGESAIAARIEDWEDALPNFIKLAYLPNLGRVRLRLSAKSIDKAMVELEMQKQIHLLLPLIDDVFVGYEEDKSIEALIALQLASMNKTLAVAESCTGGKIVQSFTANAGASQYFKGGLVTYATQSKIDILGIDGTLIKAHSVVSIEVAEAMAKNVLEKFDADYAISTTGNAGPEKGDSIAEVGTVCIGIATKNKVYAEVFNFGNHRDKVITKACNKAFEMLQKEILKK